MPLSFVFWLSDLILLWIYEVVQTSFILCLYSELLCSEHTYLQFHPMLGCGVFRSSLPDMLLSSSEPWLPCPAKALAPVCYLPLWLGGSPPVTPNPKFSRCPILFSPLVTTLLLTICVANCREEWICKTSTGRRINSVKFQEPNKNPLSLQFQNFSQSLRFLTSPKKH